MKIWTVRYKSYEYRYYNSGYLLFNSKPELTIDISEHGVEFV